MIKDDVREAIEARLKQELSVEAGALPDPIALALAQLAASETAAARQSPTTGSRSRLELAAALPL